MKRRYHRVPPRFIIISITNDCNLSLQGCYACAQNREKLIEMTIDEMRELFMSPCELGESIVMIAGRRTLS
jgi:MoaA/NifB/PqqE/SkfB family radical SAM enzyme